MLETEMGGGKRREGTRGEKVCMKKSKRNAARQIKRDILTVTHKKRWKEIKQRVGEKERKKGLGTKERDMFSEIGEK